MSIRSMYRTVLTDPFPRTMEITFRDEQQRQTLIYEKVTWNVDGRDMGLRYGENPDQPASLYRLVNGNLCLGDVECIKPGRYLASDVELLQSGKHPGKINVTDTDSALGILRYFTDRPCTVVVKHNNPSGVALGDSVAESYSRAYMADRIAAFGGVVACNREIDRETAQEIADTYCEVVVAPEYAEGAVEILAGRKNLRILRVVAMDRLAEFVGQRVVDFKSLIDGGLIVQWSQVPKLLDKSALTPAKVDHKGTTYQITREPTEAEQNDMVFGWLVEFGITSNSVIYVRDEATVGIGTGEQDRVGVAEIARDKAYRKYADRLAFQRHGCGIHAISDHETREAIRREASDAGGGLPGSIMVSDAFFPFKDSIDIAVEERIAGIIQPGGAMRDHEVINRCNDAGITMVFTGQRSFRH